MSSIEDLGLARNPVKKQTVGTITTIRTNDLGFGKGRDRTTKVLLGTDDLFALE